MEKYSAIKNGNPIDTDVLNAIFSTIYTPNTPTSNFFNDKVIQYKNGKENFSVSEKNGKPLIKGVISQDLTKKLKEEYNIKIISI